MYKAIDLAKYIVTKCVNDKCPISNLQLQKILYYIQREFLRNNSYAFSESIEAWQFGPVVPEVYYKFCGSGSLPIMMKLQPIDIAPKDKDLIDKIVTEKRQLDPWTLVEDTHKDGGAWATVYKNGLGVREVIPVELIKSVG